MHVVRGLSAPLPLAAPRLVSEGGEAGEGALRSKGLCSKNSPTNLFPLQTLTSPLGRLLTDLRGGGGGVLASIDVAVRVQRILPAPPRAIANLLLWFGCNGMQSGGRHSTPHGMPHMQDRALHIVLIGVLTSTIYARHK